MLSTGDFGRPSSSDVLQIDFFGLAYTLAMAIFGASIDALGRPELGLSTMLPLSLHFLVTFPTVEKPIEMLL